MTQQKKPQKKYTKQKKNKKNNSIVATQKLLFDWRKGGGMVQWCSVVVFVLW